MIYFKDENNIIYAYEDAYFSSNIIDDVETALEIPSGYVPLTEGEAMAQVAINIAPDTSKQAIIDSINIAAGKARLKIEDAFISVGYGTKDEYNNVALEVKRWRDAGGVDGDAPRSITSWAIPNGLTNEEAATDLEAQEVFLRGKMDDVRDLRLAGTVEVGNAASNWETVGQPHIDALNNYDPFA